MKNKLITGCLAVCAGFISIESTAQINSPGAQGYLDRGVAMYRDKNYNGCMDQLLQMRQLHPDGIMDQEALYYLAMSSLHSGDDEAIELLGEYLNFYPESARVAEVRAAMGDYYFTRAIYGKAIEQYALVGGSALPTNLADDTRYRMAYSRMMIGENEAAMQGFESLRSSREYSNAAAFYCGYINYSQGNYRQARADFDRVNQKQEPGQAVPYYVSQMDFLDGKYESALSVARAALEGDAASEFAPELNRIAGESLYHLGQINQSIPYLQKYIAAEANPRPSSLYILGYDKYMAGDYAGAIPLLQRATVANSAVGQSAYLYLGLAYAKQGDNNAALMVFDQAAQLDYDAAVSESARYNYIAARLDGGNAPFVNSVSLMEDFLKRYTRSEYAADIRRSLVNGYMSDNDYDSALRILEAASKSGDMTADMQRARQQALFMLGTRRYSDGDLSDALEYFDNAIDARGGDKTVKAQALLWAGNTLSDMDDNKEAIARYKAFLSATPVSDPLYTQGLYNMAYAQFNDEDYTAAYPNFVKVSDTPGISDQLKADALNRAADCKFADRKYNEASTLFAKAHKAYPQGGDYALYRQAEMAGYQRDYKKRISLVNELTTTYPQSPMIPMALMLKAESEEALNQHAASCDTYARLIDEYPLQPLSREAYLRMAASRASRGETDDAIATYQKLITLHPSSAEAATAMDDLKNIYITQGRLPDYVAFMNSVEGAPQVDASALEGEAFADAEQRYLSLGDTSRLNMYLEQFANGSNAPRALAYLADEALVSNRYDDALHYADRLLSKYPDSPDAEDALAMKADAQSQLGQLELALESYRELGKRAAKVENKRDAMNGLMLRAIDLGRYDDVLTATQQLLSTTSAGAPEVGKIKFYRALALERTGHGGEARQIWQPLSENLTDLYGIKSAVYLAQSLLDASQPDEAETTAHRVISTGSPHTYWLGRAFIVYSDVLRAQGKDFEANEYLKALRSNYPGQEADIFQMIDQRISQ